MWVEQPNDKFPEQHHYKGSDHVQTYSIFIPTQLFMSITSFTKKIAAKGNRDTVKFQSPLEPDSSLT